MQITLPYKLYPRSPGPFASFVVAHLSLQVFSLFSLCMCSVASNILITWWNSWLTGKVPDSGKNWGQKKRASGTWTWANSKRQWGTGRPGELQSVGSQRVRHDWVTEEQQVTSKTSHIQLCNLLFLSLLLINFLATGKTWDSSFHPWGPPFWRTGLQTLLLLTKVIKEEKKICGNTLYVFSKFLSLKLFQSKNLKRKKNLLLHCFS